MKKLLYGSLALTAAHISTATIIIAPVDGGGISISIDEAIAFTATETLPQESLQIIMLLSNIYGSNQTVGGYSASTLGSNISLSINGGSAETGETGAWTSINEYSSDWNKDDLGIAFTLSTASYTATAAHTYTISSGTLISSSALPLPSSGGTINLYLVDDNNPDNGAFSNVVSMAVTVVPEPGILASIMGALGLAALTLRRRR